MRYFLVNEFKVNLMQILNAFTVNFHRAQITLYLIFYTRLKLITMSLNYCNTLLFFEIDVILKFQLKT